MAKKVAVHPLTKTAGAVTVSSGTSTRLVDLNCLFGEVQCERAASNAFVQPPARNARLTTHMRQPPASENKVDATDGKTAASACSMGTRHSMTCSKKTHTQRHGTLVVHTQVSASSQFSQVITGRCAHRAGSKRPGSRTVTRFFSSKNTVYAARVPSRFVCLDDRKGDDIKLFKKKNTAMPWGGGHVQPCCCLRIRKPVTAPSLCTSTRAVARPQKPPHRLWR